MCSADLALEIHGPNDADDLGPQDGGWNGHHGMHHPKRSSWLHTDESAVCKDYTQVIGYLEGN